MSFFDSNQEVLDIELTSYGKYLLSKGEFNPVYYCFFDDDVIYDQSYTGQGHSSTTSEYRILEETPYLKLQSSFNSIDERIKKRQAFIANEIKDSVYNIKVKNESEYINFVKENEMPGFATMPLGTAQNLSENLPNWNINILSGEISNFSQDFTSSIENGKEKSRLNIPHLFLSSSLYDVEVKKHNSQLTDVPIEKINPQDSERPPIVSKIFNDKNYFTVSENSIILMIDEENTEFNEESIEIEIYEIVEGVERKLYFMKEETNIDEDGFLIENSRINNLEKIDLNVEYYFDIKTDEKNGIQQLSNIVPRDKNNLPIYDDPVIELTTPLVRREIQLPQGDGVVKIDREDC